MNTQCLVLKKCLRNLLVAQGAKDPVLSLQQLGLLLWHVFSPWPGNFHMPWT